MKIYLKVYHVYELEDADSWGINSPNFALYSYPPQTKFQKDFFYRNW